MASGCQYGSGREQVLRLSCGPMVFYTGALVSHFLNL